MATLCLLLAAATIAGAINLSKRQEARMKLARERIQTTPVSDRGEGYVRSETCASCHPREHQTWSKSYHRTMTQVASTETVVGKFNGVELEWAGSRYNFDQDKDGFFVEMDDPLGRSRVRTPEQLPSFARPRVKARPGLLTGSHHMQVCWIPTGLGNAQFLVPFAWLNADQRWVPFDQTFLRDPKMPHSAQIWNKNCVGCHATAPRPLYDRQAGSARTTTGELGIACEACHGPGHEHINFHRSPLNRYTAQFSPPQESRLVNPAKLDSKRSSEICGQCHSIKWLPENWNREGPTFRPGLELEKLTEVIRPTDMHGQDWVKGLKSSPRFLRDRYWKDGMVRVSGREFNGLVESPCYKRGNLSCVSCHSMHESDPNDQLAAKMDSNEACFQCHSKFRGDLEKHTHHAPKSSGSLCYNCHMPFTTYGLLKGIRSHQITSPDATIARDTGRPGACAGCHLDKSAEWLARAQANWYGQKIPNFTEDEKELPASVMMALNGDAGQRALTAFAMGWNDAQSASGGPTWLAPYLGQLMDDPYPAVRYIAHRSLLTLSQYKNFAFDFSPDPSRRPSVAAQIHETSRPNIDAAKYSTLLDARDNTSMDLQE
ncbi:MAG TPA: cytochrome c3 family protein [Verrucomicrobiae bacterium]|nr:cytochrome c3 family protein [Verrucomicrobiae bacterium]